MKTRILACLLGVLMLVSLIPVSAFAAENDTWDGTADTSWYNDSAAVFTITTPEQLAGLAQLVDGGNTFAGKTVKLGADIDLYLMGTGNEPVTFNQIGDSDHSFDGTFDGQGHTISNLYQSGWAFGYEWGHYGSIGLFGSLNNATVKDVTISEAKIFVEGGDVACITGSATGDCVFENITISNSTAATYNNGCAGIIGWAGAGNYTFKNITVDSGTVIAGLWGSFDSSLGGIMGQLDENATASFENVNVACRLDAYNDVTASYKWYSYRMCGMLIGRVLKVTQTGNGTYIPNPEATGVVCKNVTVIYDDWADYHYCWDNSLSYGCKRVESGYAYDGVDTTKYPNAKIEKIAFDQIFGGPQSGRNGYYGLKDYDGVTVHRISSSAGMEHDNTGHWYVCTENHNGEACTEKIYYEAHTPEATMAHNETAHWYVCTACGTPYGYAEHVGGDWIVDTDAEVGVEGAQHKDCIICGRSSVETESIPAKEEPVDYVLFALAARYAQRFDVHVSAENATVTGDLVIKYKRNGTVDIDVADGYQIVDVIANGQSLGVVDTVTFKRVITDQTLVVVTEPIPTEETPAVNP